MVTRLWPRLFRGVPKSGGYRRSLNTHSFQRFSVAVLRAQNERFRGTGGRSLENQHAGFQPVFKDTSTGEVYPSCFADGRPAPLHLLDGLPAQLVVFRNGDGRVIEIKNCVIAGFLCAGQFYTRKEATAAV